MIGKWANADRTYNKEQILILLDKMLNDLWDDLDHLNRISDNIDYFNKLMDLDAPMQMIGKISNHYQATLAGWFEIICTRGATYYGIYEGHTITLLYNDGCGEGDEHQGVEFVSVPYSVMSEGMKKRIQRHPIHKEPS